MEATPPRSDRLLARLFNESGGFLTRRQANEAGLEPHTLSRWVRDGRAERVQRGVYRLANAPLQNHEELLEVQLRVPYGVVCLTSALAFHRLTTINPPAVDLAVPRKSRPPRLEFPPVRYHHFADAAYRHGIERHSVGAQQLAVYDPEKTLADLLRRANRLGIDLFAEGIKNYLARRQPGPDIGRLLEAARASKVEQLMRSYLMVLAHDTTT